MAKKNWTVPVSIAVDLVTLEKADRLAKHQGKSRSKFIRDLIEKEAEASADRRWQEEAQHD